MVGILHGPRDLVLWTATSATETPVTGRVPARTAEARGGPFLYMCREQRVRCRHRLHRYAGGKWGVQHDRGERHRPPSPPGSPRRPARVPALPLSGRAACAPHSPRAAHAPTRVGASAAPHGGLPRGSSRPRSLRHARAATAAPAHAGAPLRPAPAAPTTRRPRGPGTPTV